MKIAPMPTDEDKRLENLKSYEILDTDFEKDYDEISQLASIICETPIALISLVDADRQWFKSKVGIEVRETPRIYAFCAHAILNKDDILVVKDTFNDERFSDNPLVTSDPNIRFYAGAPLITEEGYALGTICAIDRIPRELTDNQLKTLRVLSKHVIKLLELKKAFTKIQDYFHKLIQQNSQRDKFFSIVSHDIKNPFNSILSYSEILNTELDDLSKEEIKDLAENIHSVSKNTYNFLENLLRWSLFERGKLEVNAENINLIELIKKVNSLLSGAAIQKNIDINFDEYADIFVYGDKTMIFSLFQNLISNSIKFTPKGGKITTTLNSLSKYVEIKIADSGIGIEKDRLKNIFNVGAVTSTTGTQGEEGTGLGLALCQQIVNKNNGKISAESEPGKGTIFTILLPIVDNFNNI